MEEENSGQILKEINDSKGAAKLLFSVPPTLENIISHPVCLKLNHEKIKDLVAQPFPNGSILICFLSEKSPIIYDEEFKKIKINSFFIVGIHELEKRYFININRNLNAIIISLKPGGFSKLFNSPGIAVKNCIVDLNKFIPEEGKNYLKSISEINNIEEMLNDIILLLQNLLSKKSKENGNIYHKALDLIYESKCKISVNEICDSISVSVRNFERAFRYNIGITPKEYIRIKRINFVFDHLMRNNLTDWSEIIYDYGYYDQSHFIHDFKLVAGYTPKEFFNLYKNRMIYTNRYYLIFNKQSINNKLNLNKI